MFSSTMTASSITIPTASVNASKVMTLRVKCIIESKVKVAISEAGIATAAMMAERQFHRNRSTTSEARMAPRIRCSSTACSDTLMKVDSSATRRVS